jgi:gliding motility-associated-like protein
VNIPLTYRLVLVILLLAASVRTSYASTGPQPVVSSETLKLIENKGQWDPQVLFKAAIPGGDLFITPTGIVYALVDEKTMHEISHGESRAKTVNAHNYKMFFAGGNSRITVRKGAPFSEYYNYFLGNDHTRWASRCQAYGDVVLENVYNGIDVEIVAQKDFIKLNFIVHPSADPSQIRLNYSGQDDLQLKDGELHIRTSVANIKEEKPFAYQLNREVFCKYVQSGNQVTFDVGSYDLNTTMVIDPNIIFGTFSGSVADNFGFTATYDKDGNGFAGGTVYSSGFPVSLGAFQLNFSGTLGTHDAGILKFSSDGTRLLYATYIGGTSNEQPHSIICNPAGDLYVMGTTSSFNFPRPGPGFDKTPNGGFDIFVVKLSADGTQMQSSTFWGGSQHDGINGDDPDLSFYRGENPLTFNYGDFYRGEIKLDNSGNVLIASTTRSTPAHGYFVTNGFQHTFGGGGQDGCIVKFQADLSTVLFSSYIGGSGEDAAYGIALDEMNNIFVCGGTTSPDIGRLNGTFTYKGDVDAFVARISPFGSNLQKLIYLGTAAYDQSYFVDVDLQNNVYITGQTLGNFPVKGAVYTNTGATQFVSVFNNALDDLQLSTVFGSPNATEPNVSPSAFMVDACGKVYFSGWGGASNMQFNWATGNTSDMPVSPDAFQRTTDGSDFYLIVLGKDLAKLEYASYFGGSIGREHVDGGTSRFDKKGVVYQSVCAGCGGSSDFPTTPDAYSRTNMGRRPGSGSGGCNNALFKLSLNLSYRPPIVKDTFFSITATDSLTYAFDIIDPDGDSVDATITGNIFSITNNPPTINMLKRRDRVRAVFNWKTLCSHISPDTIVIDIVASDNACLVPNVSTGKIKILVNPPPLLAPPYPECLQTINDSTVKLKWTPPPSLAYFKQYLIYKRTGSGAPVLYKTLTNPADTQFTDTLSHNHHVTNYCYFIQTVNACNVISLPSRSICSIYEDDPMNPVFMFTRDTTLFVTATDTISYSFEAVSLNAQDSVFLTVTGTLPVHPRLLNGRVTADQQKAAYTFRWYSDCDDTKRTDTLVADIFIRDNQCPQARTQKARVRVVVTHPPVVSAPPLKCVRNIGTDQTLIRWEKPVVDKHFSHFVLIRKNPDGTWSQLGTVSNDSILSFTDSNAPGNEQQDFCYTAYAVNVCGDKGDTADFSCSVTKNTEPPKPVYIHTTTVEHNRELLVTWTKSNETDFFKYRIFRQRSKDQGRPVQYRELEGINDTIMIDKDVDVQANSYCYELRQLNGCGQESPENTYRSCSILLKGISVPFSHRLSWSEYDFWENGLAEYAVIRQEPDESPVKIGRSAYKMPSATDSRLNIENGLYYYTIVASEVKSPFHSVSNTIELIQKPLLHVPNAFTPNGDNVNDTWETGPVFVKDYNLKLYDRWGQLIFQTTDKHHSFKDEFRNAPVSSDVFVYLVTYTGWDGSSHVQKGNVTLLK